MAEKLVGPFPLINAENYMVELMDASGAFQGGGKPVVGRLELSYGYKKIIGVCSFDNRVNTRIDFEPARKLPDGTIIPGKGYHFNFTNSITGDKICIQIEGMTEDQYKKYIDRLTKGKDIDLKNPKRDILVYDPKTGERTPVIWDEKIGAYVKSYIKYADKKIEEGAKKIEKGNEKVEELNDMVYNNQPEKEQTQEVSNKKIN